MNIQVTQKSTKSGAVNRPEGNVLPCLYVTDTSGDETFENCTCHVVLDTGLSGDLYYSFGKKAFLSWEYQHNYGETPPPIKLPNPEKGQTIGGTLTCTSPNGSTITKRFTIVHNHQYGSTVNKVNATCTEGGYSGDYKCGLCGDIYRTGSSTSARGHNFTSVKAVTPTCTTPGKTGGTKCSRCGIWDVAQETVPALGHSYDDGVITTPPTCTEPGIKTFTCTRCNDQFTEEIAPSGHTAASELSGYIAPTHTTPGYSGDVVCKTCGAIITKGTTVQASGHVMGEWSPNGGTEHIRVCADGPECNIEHEPHTFSEWATSVDPACLEEGSQHRECSICGYQEEQAIPALGHSYTALAVKVKAAKSVIGVVGCDCTRCGHQIRTPFTKLKRNKPQNKSN